MGSNRSRGPSVPSDMRGPAGGMAGRVGMGGAGNGGGMPPAGVAETWRNKMAALHEPGGALYTDAPVIDGGYMGGSGIDMEALRAYISNMQMQNGQPPQQPGQQPPNPARASTPTITSVSMDSAGEFAPPMSVPPGTPLQPRPQPEYQPSTGWGPDGQPNQFYHQKLAMEQGPPGPQYKPKSELEQMGLDPMIAALYGSNPSANGG